jgi:hypothetical protein
MINTSLSHAVGPFMRCDKLIQIRAPETLAKALNSAADKRLTSRSDYIRGALLDRLRADEIDILGVPSTTGNSQS